MPDFDNSFLVEDAGDDSIHEDALVFELAEGQPVGWRASGLAIKRASDKGMELGQILEDLRKLFGSSVSEEELEEMSEEEIEEELEGGASFAQLVDLVGKLTWLGALHFEPNVSRRRVLAAMDSESLARVPLEEMLSKVFPALSEEVEEKEEEGKA
ncbi:hypothetical protein GGQ13_003048 [Salinibacter ruber]|uniref:hypothetical protein n=1 Tax=Salinibacter ruber TaxID=146919 RepID=UPI0021695957|nr:hypothetical protein [Salinibacter ruber]MCS4139593.1 hypothetical protein [Salinibacter ruber]